MKKILPKILIIGAIIAVVGGVLYFVFGRDDWAWCNVYIKSRKLFLKRNGFSSFSMR